MLRGRLRSGRVGDPLSRVCQCFGLGISRCIRLPGAHWSTTTFASLVAWCSQLFDPCLDTGLCLLRRPCQGFEVHQFTFVAPDFRRHVVGAQASLVLRV